MARYLVALVVALGLLGGCAAPPVSLDPRAQAQAESAESVLLIPQAALIVDVNRTYIGGGLLDQLLAAYVDSKRKDTATDAARPITAQLEGYDFRTVMRDAWAQEFSKAGVARLATPVHVESIEIESPEWTTRKRTVYDASTASAVLFAAIDWRLQSGTLIVSAKLEIYPKSAALMAYRKSPDKSDPLAEGNAIYRKDFANAKEFITANNIRRNVDEGVLAIARQVAADLARLQP